jgi:hypothetical protein
MVKQSWLGSACVRVAVLEQPSVDFKESWSMLFEKLRVGSVAQCEFLLSCLIKGCSAATSTLTGMETCWQSDKNATTDPTTSHQHDIGVALIDALHAISNETSKAGTHPSQSPGEACEGLFTRNSGRPLYSTQARESLTVPSYFFSPYFSSLFACLFTSKIPRSLHLSAYSIFCRSCPSRRFALTS